MGYGGCRPNANVKCNMMHGGGGSGQGGGGRVWGVRVDGNGELKLL